MKVEIVIISSMAFGFCSWCLVLGSRTSQREDEAPSTKFKAQIFMFSIFLTINIPVTCRNNAVAIR